MENGIQSINADQIKNYSAFVGFDGYVDEIVRPIGPNGRFESIRQFNDYIIKNDSASADINVKRIFRHMGGNAPLLAYSLAKKGLSVHCVGAFGKEKVLPAFDTLNKCCDVLTIAEPAECYALEFPDGKIMFGERSALDEITPALIRQKAGEKLFNIIMKSRLICSVNWSGLLYGNEILREILLQKTQAVKDREQILFLDLADLSAVGTERTAILKALLPKLRERYYTILSLNRKEAAVVTERLGAKAGSLQHIARTLAKRLKIDEITIHSPSESIAIADENETGCIVPKPIKDPVVVTGAGDNYNAGYCIAKLLGMDPDRCVRMGNASAYNYICSGEPCELEQIVKEC